MKEADLYPPLKIFLEAQNYEIKGEVGPCDVFAVRAGEPPLVVELKLSLNLTVVLQAVERLALTSSVYIGLPRGCSALKRNYRPVRKMLRLLGIGLLTIDPSRSAAAVRVLLDPGDYRPRVSKQRQARLLAEFEKRVGDPNRGGSAMRGGIVTAYRQRAVGIALYLREQGPSRAADVAERLQDAGARDIMYRDVYGWFDRVSRGVYQLSPRGEREIASWAEFAPR